MPQDDSSPKSVQDLDTESLGQESAESKRELPPLVVTTFEFLGGVAKASAEAFEVLNSHLASEQPSVIEGLWKSNARFLHGLSRAAEDAGKRAAAEKPKN